MKLDWQESFQDEEYLDLCVARLDQSPLIWVEQFNEIIKSKLAPGESVSINDLGCCVGHFAREVNKVCVKPEVEYMGYDISQCYIDIASKM